jgi:ATP-dependent RNA helicase RhlE
MQFTDLGLDGSLLKAISEEGYTTPTPIQAQSIPAVLSGQDIMAAAQTGTGKTASFTLPMLHQMVRYANTSVSPARHPVRALILTPTRELAAQVEESAKAYGKHLPLRIGAVFGGVPMDPQVAMLRAGVEILVATPGRLLDHIEAKNVNFNTVEFLVLDEADRMLDMGFLPDITRIVKLIPGSRQTLLFSATYSDEIRKLASSWLKDPIKIEVAPRNTVTDTIKHTVMELGEYDKSKQLLRLIESGEIEQVLVFCNTKIGANRLTRFLQNKQVGAEAIHSDRTQSERMTALANFKERSVTVLVATDIAARGLDIEQLPFVVNYDLPHNPEDYVHRIGRTGRAGQSGEAISFCSEDDRESLQAVEKLIKKRLEVRPALRGSRETSAGRSDQRLQRKQLDPFFTEPYEPGVNSAPLKQSETNGQTSESALHNSRRSEKRAIKPAAALFRPPVKDGDG